jgi:hypothetical protein
MNFKHVLLAATMAAALGSQSAMAGNITATYLGSAQLGSGAGVGYATGTVSPGPGGAISANVLIGGDSFTATPDGSFGLPSGKFDAWCVDIYHWLTSPSYFTTADASTLAATLQVLRPNAPPTGTQRVNDLNKLANVYYSTLRTNSATDSAAFQLAVWAITYGTQDSSGHYHIDSTNAGFHVDATTAGSAWGQEANTWLDNFSTAANTANYNIIYLSDGASNSTQDLVVFVQTAGATVPEPGMLSLVGLGLLAAAALRRRKQA